MKLLVIVAAAVCAVALATALFAVPSDKPVTFAPAVPTSQAAGAALLPVSVRLNLRVRGFTVRPAKGGKVVAADGVAGFRRTPIPTRTAVSRASAKTNPSAGLAAG